MLATFGLFLYDSLVYFCVLCRAHITLSNLLGIWFILITVQHLDVGLCFFRFDSHGYGAITGGLSSKTFRICCFG